MNEEEIKKLIEDHIVKSIKAVPQELVQLKNKTFHTNWLFAGIGIILLVFAIWFFTSSYYDYKMSLVDAQGKENVAKTTEVQVAQAEAQRQEALTVFMGQVAQNQKNIAAMINQQGAIAKRDRERDVRTQATITEVTQASRTSEQIAKDSEDYLGIRPEILPNGLLYRPGDVQMFIATRIDRDRLEQKVKDTGDQLDLERQKTKDLSTLVEKSTVAIENSNKMVEDYKGLVTEYKTAMDAYKKAAVKSRWQKIWDVTQKVGFVAIGIGIGAALH